MFIPSIATIELCELAYLCVMGSLVDSCVSENTLSFNHQIISIFCHHFLFRTNASLTS